MLHATLHRIVAIAYCISWVVVAVEARAQTLYTLSDWTVGLGPIPLDATDAAFYRSHADPVRDEAKMLPGGRWVLETDRRSRLAYPRLLSLAQGESVTRVNEILQAIHGRNLRWELAWRRRIGALALGRADALDEPAVEQTGVRMTYLSAKHVSLVALGERLGPANGGDVLAQGAAIDLQRRTIFTINACPGRSTYFTFGTLMTVCDDRKLEAFRALWREQALIVKATAPYETMLKDTCRAWVLAYVDDNESAEFSLYLTPGGLAVHNVFTLRGALERGCHCDPESPFFPIVIPWSKLEPLLNSGPLRDELLARH